MAMIKRVGYGQVEPNHLSAQRNGQVYGQLPAAAEIEVLENGQFVKYDYAKGVCNFKGAGEWMLVYNEVKLYNGYRETYKDFAMKKKNYDKGEMVPRVLKTMPGDIFTTNCIGAEGEDVEVESILKINDKGYLSLTGDSDIEFQVVKVYTMPDGQPAVKVMRVK